MVGEFRCIGGIVMSFNKKTFSVKIIGRAGLIYKENGKILMIDSEMLTGGDYDMVIYTDSMNKWESPNDKLELTEKEKNQIKSNIKSELRNIRIEWS
jgi:Immunity protein 74